MVFQIGRELHLGEARDWSAWRCLVKYKNLVVVGLLSNAALWIDKVVFWSVDGSGPNRSHDRFRRSFICHYLPVSALECSHWFFPLLDRHGTVVDRTASNDGGPCGMEKPLPDGALR